MYISVEKNKLQYLSDELMHVSGALHRLEAQASDINAQLRFLSDMEECRRSLTVQTENIALLSARIAALSQALRGIASLYSNTEQQSTAALHPNK